MEWKDVVEMKALIGGMFTLRETSGDRYRGIVTRLALGEDAKAFVSLRDVKVSHDRGRSWEDAAKEDEYFFDTASTSVERLGAGIKFNAFMLGQVDIRP